MKKAKCTKCKSLETGKMLDFPRHSLDTNAHILNLAYQNP